MPEFRRVLQESPPIPEVGGFEKALRETKGKETGKKNDPRVGVDGQKGQDKRKGEDKRARSPKK